MRIDFLYGESYTTINSNYVTKLSQEASSFIDNRFYLGSTVCRAFTLSIDKKAIASLPDDGVKIYDDEDNIYADLVIDSIDDSDTKVYTFNLTDRMVRLNASNSTWFESGATIQELIDNICSVFGITTSPTLTNYGTIPITWYDNWTARDFVSWVAELLGGYAYISNNNALVFSHYTNTPSATISLELCDSFKLGEQILINRVVYDTPSKTVIYPEEDNGEGCTLYLNTNNQLFTDSGSLTIEDEVQYIYNQINGFSFYGIEVGKCPINPEVKAGDCIGFTYNNLTFNTIAQVNWQYNTMWVGGYQLDIESPIQQETQIVSPITQMGYTITEKIDRENGIITSSIYSVQSQVNDNSADIVELGNTITRTAESLTVDFNVGLEGVQNSVDDLAGQVGANTNSIKQYNDVIKLTGQGVIVSNPGSSVRGVFGNDALEFIDNSSGSDTVQAWIGADGLGGRELNVGDPNTLAKQWRIITSTDGSHLRFTRHS